MSPRRLSHTVALVFCLPLHSVLSQTTDNIVEERTTYDAGVWSSCGTGDGLSPCRDANGQTYQEEVHGPDLNSETEAEMVSEAARIRAESPAELNGTISELERGYNPDVRATEGLPH